MITTHYFRHNFMLMLIICFFTFNIHSATYTMGTSGSQSATVTAISGAPDVFYDNGGVGSNYSSSISGATYTFNCAGGKYVRMKVNSLGFGGSWGADVLTVYDGASTASRVIGSVSAGDASSFMWVSTTGSLTFSFTTDGATVSSGWSCDVYVDDYAGQKWLGGTSSDVAIAANWEGSFTPGYQSSIYIDAALYTNAPQIVTTSANLKANSFYLKTGATFTQSIASYKLICCGIATIDGTFSTTGETDLYMDGSASNQCAIGGAGTFSTIYLKIGYTFSASVKLASNVSVTRFYLGASGGVNTSSFDMNGYNLTVTSTTGGAGGAFTIRDLNQTFNQNTGTLNVNASSWDLGGVFNCNTGTTNFARGGTQTIPSTTFYNLTVSGGAGTQTLGGDIIVGGNLLINTGNTLATANFNISCAGNWTNSGLFTCGIGTVTFNGTTSLNANGTTYPFYNVIMNGTSVTLAGAIKIGGSLTLTNGTWSASTFALTLVGNWVNNATYDCGTGTVTFGPAGSNTTISGSSTNTFYGITVTGTLVAPAGTIYVSRNWDSSTGTFTHSSGTVCFNGTSTCKTHATTSDFYNVTLNGVSVTQNTAIFIDNNLVITSGTWDTKSGSNYALTVGGGITNNGTFTARSGTVTLNGGSAQEISGSVDPNFYNLTLNNASGASISVNTTVQSTFTFSTGLFTTQGYTLTIGTNGTNGSVSGYSSTRYFVAYDSGTIGSVKQFINLKAPTSYVYPIGDLTNYTPFTITVNSASTLAAGAYFTMYTKAAKISGLNASITTYLTRYWRGTDFGITTPDYDISYAYSATDVIGGTEANLMPIKKSGTTWNKPTGSTFTNGTTVGTGGFTVGTRTLTWTGLTSFSDYGGVGPQAVGLPIELISFSGKKMGDYNELNWITHSESNNDYFTIEKTKDGLLYEMVGTQNGANNSNSIQNYSLIDQNIQKVINYYRLIQTDYDGKNKVSNLITIDNREVESTTKVISRTTNILGQEIDDNYRGLIIITYSDGSSMKTIR